MNKIEKAIKKLTAKKVAVKEVEEKTEGVVCPNCENSGLSCYVCKLGRDDVV